MTPPVTPEETPAARFFDQVRAVSCGDRASLDLTLGDMEAIASDLTQLGEFRRRYKGFSQDPEAKALVLDILRGLMRADADRELGARDRVELVDRYLRVPAITAAVGGTGALVYGAAAAGLVASPGAVALVLAGVAGWAGAALARATQARRARIAARRRQSLEDLLNQLEATGA